MPLLYNVWRVFFGESRSRASFASSASFSWLLKNINLRQFYLKSYETQPQTLLCHLKNDCCLAALVLQRPNEGELSENLPSVATLEPPDNFLEEQNIRMASVFFVDLLDCHLIKDDMVVFELIRSKSPNK